MAVVKVRKLEVTQADGGSYQVPYWEITTGMEGSCVLVTAAFHGNELQGSEVLRRCQSLLAEQLTRGRCLLVPFANLCAIQQRQPHIDYELGRYYGSDCVNNANAVWPGKLDGSNAQRLGYALYHSVVAEATHNLDLHSWNRYWATTALARTDYQPSLQLARITALRFARHAVYLPEVKKRPVFPCTLTSLFNDTGRAAICIEFSGQYALYEREIARGVRAVKNYFRFLDMLPGALEGQDDVMVWLNDAEEAKITAPHSGLFCPAALATSDQVAQGDLLGTLLSDDDLRVTEIRAPMPGYLYQLGAVRGVGKTDTVADQQTTLHHYVSQGEILAVIYRPRK